MSYKKILWSFLFFIYCAHSALGASSFLSDREAKIEFQRIMKSEGVQISFNGLALSSEQIKTRAIELLGKHKKQIDDGEIVFDTYFSLTAENKDFKCEEIHQIFMGEVQHRIMSLALRSDTQHIAGSRIIGKSNIAHSSITYACSRL